MSQRLTNDDENYLPFKGRDRPVLREVEGVGMGLFSDEILDRLQSTYRDVHDLTADFVQRSSIQGFEEKVFKGKLYLKKPKLARWDYTKPVKQNIFIKDEKIILYFHEQKQAIVQKASDHPDAEPAMGLLSNIEKWQDMFTIKGEDIATDFFKMELYPKAMSMVEKVVVEIEKKTSHISKLTLYEKSGNKVSFDFSGIKFNTGLKDSLFDFKIPKGVEVLEY
ncbi:MAG: outer membrane lipoprotein carrier protein LolA [Nitrospirae bacterium]|nr:outer membrane lipoprotein carrier protein LolA [Nitrospirota bacterium]